MLKYTNLTVTRAASVMLLYFGSVFWSSSKRETRKMYEVKKILCALERGTSETLVVVVVIMIFLLN